MPSLRIKWNYRQDIAIPAITDVRVLRRDGTWAIKRWLGFVDLSVARKIQNARPVKIEVWAYGSDDHWLVDVTFLEKGEYIQGALTPLGVYAVTLGGLPRVVR